jgi:DNA-binding response OmpR family regulator
MTRLSYETAEALIFDPVTVNRNATRSALIEVGFRRIEGAATPEAFARYLYQRSPDIALCEVQSNDARICDMIASLRGGALGSNPFIVIIATAWEKSQALVSRVINSGADDLILRPFSTGILTNRIETHTEKRKGFVITHDYIGPDRRRDSNRISTVRLFDPPNSLNMKAIGHKTTEALAKRLDRELTVARGFLQTEKIRRDAFQICVLWRLLSEGNPWQKNYTDNLVRVAVVSRAVARRSAEIKLAGASVWCDAVLSAVHKLEQNSDRDEALKLLERASWSLVQTVNPTRSAEDHQVELDAAISAIRSREAQAKAS